MNTTTAVAVRLGALLAFLCLGLTACFGGDGDGEETAEDDTTGGAVTVDDVDDAAEPEEPAPEFLGGWEWEPESAAVEYAFPIPDDVEPNVSSETDGVSLTIEQVRFGDDRIDVRMTAENTRAEDSDPVVLAGGWLTRTRTLELEDDTGTVYLFSPAFADDELTIPPQRSATTRVTFIGRIHPEATELTLTTNTQDIDGVQHETRPVISVTWPIQPAGSDEVVGSQAQHPGRTTLRINGIEANGDHTVVRATAASRSHDDQPRSLAETDMELVEADGTRHPLVPPEGNDKVQIDPAKAHDLELVFAGSLAPDGGPVTVITNSGFHYLGAINGTHPGTQTPAIVVEDLVAPEVAEPPLRVVHPLRLTATVLGMEVWSDRIAVDVELVNGYTFDLGVGADPIVLTDGTGAEIGSVSERLRLPQRTTTRSTLVFEGSFSEVPAALTLAFNQQQGRDTDSGTTPRVILEDIPTSGVGDPISPDRPAGPRVDSTDLPASVVGDGLELVSDEAVIGDILTDLDAEIAEDITVTLEDEVLFDFDSDVLTEPGRRLIAEVAEVIAFYDGAPVRIDGHTDSRGDPGYNQGLSERRAAAVVAALTGDHGIDPARLQSQGFGETQPVAPNEHPDGSDNPEGRAQNRRVEIIIEADPADTPDTDDTED